MRCRLLAPLLLLALATCRSAAPRAPADAATKEGAGVTATGGDWVLVVHGGAGRRLDPALEPQVRAGLESALRQGAGLLASGGSSLDAVELVVATLEDDPLFNAGRGAVYTRAGTHELDAAIVDGGTRAAGAVAALRTVKNPIRLARLVMERSPHVLLVGEGAEAFATAMGVERVENSWFDTPRRRRQLDEELAKERQQGAALAPGGSPATAAQEASPFTSSSPAAGWIGSTLGTVGAVARDRDGHLAAATSTGGTTAKLPGRVGDAPLVGAGTWADDATCAISATGKGEQFIRHAAAARVAMLMSYGGRTLEQAAREVVEGGLSPGDGGLIAVGRDGSVAMPFNTESMARGVADARGRLEVATAPPKL
jgi:beta-aspartyl-peptidase (threonine type)